MLVGHAGHAIFDRLFRRHEHRKTRHDFFYLGLPGELSLQDDFSRIVAEAGMLTAQVFRKRDENGTEVLVGKVRLDVLGER